MKDSIRVLQICEPTRDGVFVHLKTLIQHLLRKGIVVDLLYSSERSSFGLKVLLDQIEESGGITHDLAIGSKPSITDLRALWIIHHFVAKNQPDVIHAHSSKAGALARINSVFASRYPPVVYTPNAYYGMGRESYISKIYNFVERNLASKAFTINVSNDESIWARLHLRTDHNKSEIIPNSVEINIYRPHSKDSKQKAKARLGLPLDSCVIGSVGRLCYQKNPVLMIDGFAELVKKISHAHLLIVGQGELEDSVNNRIRDESLFKKVTRIPYTSQMVDIYGAIDVFASTSRYEGLPLVVLEALASNLPCVLNKVPGLSEFSTYGFSHLRYPESDTPESFGQALYSSCLEIKEKQVPNHSAIALNKFCPYQNSDSIIEVYKRVIQTQGADKHVVHNLD